MGKFPGRLTFRTGARKRIAVHETNSSTSAKGDVVSQPDRCTIGLSLGLNVFHHLFGSEKEVIQDFKGFTFQEIKKTIDGTRKNAQPGNLGVVDPSQNLHPQPEEHVAGNTSIDALSENFEKDVKDFLTNPSCDDPTPNKASHCKRGRGRPRIHRSEPTSPNNYVGALPSSDKTKQINRCRIIHRPTHHTKASANSNEFKPTIKKLIANKLLQKAKKSTSNLTNLERSNDLTHDKSANGASRKFVLPYRSAHSSRVIKPSKRCLESEEVLSEPRTRALASTARNNQSLLKEPKLILSATKIDLSTDSNSTGRLKRFDDLKPSSITKSSSLTNKFCGFDGPVTNSFQNSGEGNLIIGGKRRWKPSYKVHLELHELNVFGAGTSRFSKDQSMSPSQNSSCKIAANSSPDSSTTSSSESNLTIDTSDKHTFGSFDFGSKNSKTSPSLLTSSTSFPSPNKSSGSKVVLREARLQLDSKVYATGEPSSFSKESSNPSMPGTVVCGVCGAVRFYKFVKQAKKFGIICCESCRKFISKVMVRHMSTSYQLHCLQGEGKGPCQTVPIVRNQQWKTAVILRKNYKARCPACWLRICLLNFNKMPDSLRRKLAKLLPESMQDGIPFTNPDEDQQSSDGSVSSYFRKKQDKKEKPNTPLVLDECKIKRKSKKKVMEFGTVVEENNTSDEKTAKKKEIKEKIAEKKVKNTKGDIQSKKKKANLQKHRILEKASKKLVKSSIKQVTKSGKKNGDREKSKNHTKKGSKKVSTSEGLRQKHEMKGPRVKHVCRSASVVLGQLKAIFPKLDKKPVPVNIEPGVSVPSKKTSKGSYCKDCDKTSKAHDCTHSVDGNQDTGSKKCSAAPTDVTKNSLMVNQGAEVPSNLPRKVNKLQPQPPVVPVRTMQLPRQLPLVEPKSLVSIDFWDYDPDQVTHTGFGLIGSEPFYSRAVCFLCGSAGTEKLIHCASCCDPYHRFCLYDGLRDATMSVNNSKDEWRLDWLCPRCTVCGTCGESAGAQMSCQHCRKTYHPSCLDAATLARAKAAKRPWMCAVCLQCNSCGQGGVMRFVGNLPFCKPCFKLTKKGNYCPICQKCYEDDDFDTKMMECAQCKRWIHANCEDISDENYLVLSFLPESVEFVCRLCCSVPSWRSSVEEELKNGCKAVIQVLLKKCKNRPMLTHSPLKKRCSCRAVGVTKRLALPGSRDDPIAGPSSPLVKEEVEATSCNLSEATVKIKEEVVDNVPVETKESGEVASDERGTKQLPVCSIDAIEDYESKSALPKSEDSSSNSCRASDLEELNGPLKLLRVKYNIKDCSVSVQKMEARGMEDRGVELSDCALSDCSGRSPEKLNSSSSLTPTDSGIGSTDDELKPGPDDGVRVYAPSTGFEYSEEVCRCADDETPPPTLLSVEKKVCDREFASLGEFDRDMDRLLEVADCSDLLNIYHRKLKEVFPWFNPIRAQVQSFPGDCEERQEGAVTGMVPARSLPEPRADAWAMPEGFLGKSLAYYYSDAVVEDVRACSLCRKVGEGLPCEEGRLLYCGQNEWAHANCALWSSEVFEEVDGSLQNVHSAVFRGRKLNCEGCGAKGASVGCCSRNCFATYHFRCAQHSGCRFMEDKTFFCPAHVSEALGKAVQNHEEFDLRRPIYVESDRKKKKFVEPEMAKFMVGSLTVERLGIVVPGASDTPDTIIPANFMCTRLYWSSVEPWRIVRYTVKTSVPEIRCEPASDHGVNVTIDHTLDSRYVRQKLEEVEAWHRQLKSQSLDTPPAEAILITQEVKQVVDSILDAVCSREAEENLSDTQNAADLLPPELTDAIFEDLPHDLLDGISMQDIFPKLMNDEDCFGTDPLSEGREGVTYNEGLGSKSPKTGDDILDTREWFEDPKELAGDVAVSLHVEGERELKRSRSEIIPLPVGSTVSTRGQKRSCSLNWNCKLDSSKRRKIQGRATRSSVGGGSSADKLQGSRLPDGVLVTLACSTAPTTPVPGSVGGDLKDPAPGGGRHRAGVEEEGKENKCLVWRGRRLAQLDGAAESSSSCSESGSPPPPDVRGEEGPVRCPRCRSTYRTRISYERHVPTCRHNFMLSTSESDSETRSSEGDFKREPEEGPASFAFRTDADHIYGDVQGQHTPGLLSTIPEESIPCPTHSPESFAPRVKPKFTYQRSTRQRGRPKASTKPPPVPQKPGVQSPPNLSILPQTVPSQPLVQPAVIVQQVPSSNMMPAYIESFQQQTGHSLQYIASIDIQSNAFNKTQFLTNGPIPGTFQLQPAPDYGNLSLMPGVQLTPQPTVLGTIIQQPQTSLQCGMVAQDQIVLGGAPLEVYTDQSGGMFLANQPVYYGLETIVSNTVMSSSQYVSGMQGVVAASSSFSATTTQVYQANKVETILDPTPGFMIVPGPQLSAATSISRNPVAVRLPPRLPPPTVGRPRSIPWMEGSRFESQPRPAVRKRPCYMPEPRISPRPCLFSFSKAVTRPSTSPSISTLRFAPVRTERSVTLPLLKNISAQPKDRTSTLPLEKTTPEGGASVEKPLVRTTPLVMSPDQHQTVVVNAIATDKDKGSSKPIKLVLQKSPQNGLYRISHHIPQSNVLKTATQPTAGDVTPVTKEVTGGTSPLAENVKVKRRWQPSGKPAPQPPAAPPRKIVFEVSSKDGFSCTSTSIARVWEKVFEAVQLARKQHKMPPLARNPFRTDSRGLEMLGLDHNGFRYLAEQLPGVNRCARYRPRHHEPRPPAPDDGDSDVPPEPNPSGCCRAEHFSTRAPYDLFSWLASRHRKPPRLIAPAEETAAGSGRRATSSNLPMAMRFRHLKETSKRVVGVYRSHIHGRGLFCLRDIEGGEMVIEYAGEVIRSTLTDYREKLYDERDIGCYMFRIDDHLVVDATLRGNAARFINHSCEPNCYSKVVDILGKKHILIFALRRIPQGEELTYDYKFPFEDIKIPCSCGSRKCRKYLN